MGRVAWSPATGYEIGLSTHHGAWNVFTLKARVDAIDFDTEAVGQHVRQASAGINFRPTSESVIKTELVRGWSYDQFNNRSDFVRLLASFATYF